MSSHSHHHAAHSGPCLHDHNDHHAHHNVLHKLHNQPEINTLAHFVHHIKTDKDAKKLVILLMINIVCTLLELIYGFLSNSIGLISDAAHMLFDSTALAVGVYASYKAKLPPNNKFSFGYERFQTLAGFINGIFLIFIAFYIFIESLERIYDPPVIYSEKMIVVAIIGLIVNVIGVTFFHEHAHFHGIDDNHSCGHQHTHNEHQHKVSTLPDSQTLLPDTPVDSRNQIGGIDSRTQIQSSISTRVVVDSLENVDNDDHKHHHHGHHHDHHHECMGHDHDNDHGHSHQEHEHDHGHKHEHEHEHGHGHGHEGHSHGEQDNHHVNNENLYGVFLHILADLLGSVGVITSSILIMMFGWYIADAICSAVTSLLILVSIVPLMKSSILIFLQTYPSKHEKVFHQALVDISKHPSILECKEPHLWAYTHDTLVCSLILVLQKNTTNVEKVLKFAREKLKTIKGIKHLTVDYQMENALNH